MMNSLRIRTFGTIYQDTEQMVFHVIR